MAKYANKGKIVSKLSSRGDVKNPEALAAWLARRKYGKSGAAAKAGAGRTKAAIKRGGIKK